METNRIAVYTSIFGDYDSLKEPAYTSNLTAKRRFQALKTLKRPVFKGASGKFL